jgi:colanic acid/amylovoran biosynthesis glycosyltransferase
MTGLSDWSKVHVVRCGINMADFEPSSASFDQNTTFVCVGRLCIQKAQTLILEALDKVRQTHPEVRLLLVGDGETRPEVETKIAQLKLQDHVTLMGWRSNAEVRQLVGGSRALLLPSLSEGLPIALMEALALGRPVITTYIAGIPELVDQRNGWIIPAGSVERIAEAMKEALEASSATLIEKGQQGRQRVVLAHDIRKNAAKLRQILVQNAPR